jgi:hypothetical protein
MWIIPTPWGPISFHFCIDEARMVGYSLLVTIPFVGSMWLWIRSKFKKHDNCCHDHTNDREHKIVAHPEKEPAKTHEV